MFAILKSTFGNNPMSIVITVLGVLYVSNEIVYEPFKEWRQARAEQSKQDALVDRCVSVKEATNEIERQADKARNSADNSFINQ